MHIEQVDKFDDKNKGGFHQPSITYKIN